MSILKSDLKYKLLTAGAALLAGVVVKAALSATWKGVTKNEPPQNPEDSDVTWREAIAWTVASSVAMGVAGLIARRGMAEFVSKPMFGEEPIV